MAASTFERGLGYRRVVQAIRGGPLAGRWLFAWVVLAQLGHLLEHISVALLGKPVLGSTFDSELWHLIFNGAIALLSIVLLLVYPRNPWVYLLAVLSIFHGIEHVYIFEQSLHTGLLNAPGLLGLGGVIGIFPLGRLELHNAYNGIEMILMVLGFWHETEVLSE